ncbi:MAG: hypothetical protein DDT22_00850 [candidate division WS2 bacterium]|nr:hypothetical protein [Candidatus Lithacetigena glycinireducens]
MAWAQVDVTPPGKITGFAAVLGEQIRLTWIAPGDDNYSGSVTGGKFLIKYSTLASSTADTAQFQIQLSSNFTPGTTQTFSLTGLMPSSTHYIWIRASDERKNWSVWSDTASGRASSFFISQTFPGLRDNSHGENAFGFSDINNDGHIDLVVSGYDGISRQNVVYKNTSGSFSVWQNLSTGLQTSAICLADVNLDARQDMFVIGSPDGVNRRFIVYRNIGGDTPFALDSEPFGSDGFISGGLAVLDFDNDGDNDIAVCGIGPIISLNNRYLRIYENKNSSFTLHPAPGLVGLSNSAIAVGNYNNDGWVDLAAIGRDISGNRRFILFKNSSGTFLLDQEPLGANVGVEFGSIAFCDYDSDGDLDLAICGTDGTNRRFILFKNDNGVFTLNQQPLGSNIGVDNGSLAFGDYNNDGWPDLVLTGRDNAGNNRFILFKNISGIFSVDQEVLGANVGVQQSSVLFGDIDNDRDLDLVVSGLPTGGISNLIRVYRNATSGYISNNPPLPPNMPSASTDTDGRLVISFTNGSDDKTPSQSLNYILKVATLPFSMNPSRYVVSPHWATPFTGNYPKPKRKAGANKILIANLANSVTYYFSVASMDSIFQKSNWSSVRSYYLADIYPPFAITDIVAQRGNNEGEIRLTWTSPADAPGNKTVSAYFIKFATYSVSNLSGDTTAWWNRAILMSNPPVPSPRGSLENIILTGLFPSTTYYFSIKSADFDRNISPIDLQTSTRNQRYNFATDIAPRTPTNVRISARDKTVTLSWNDMRGEVGYMDFDFYEIFRSSSESPYNFFSHHITTHTIFIDTRVVNGVLYHYRIRAQDKPPMILTSEFSAIVSTMPVGVPVAPSNFSGIALSTYSIKWSWRDNSSDEKNFIIRTPSKIIKQLPANSTYWIETTLNANTVYERYVEAKNHVGISSSAVAGVYTLANPPTRSNIVSVSSFSVSISWSANGNPPITRYGILRSTDSRFTSAAKLTTFDSNQTATMFLASNLLPLTSYWFKINAFNGNGIATKFDLTIGTVTLSPPAAAPLGFFGVALSTGVIKWGWQVTENATYYRVYNHGDNMLLANIEGARTTTWIEYGLSPNMRYSRYVRAGNEHGLSGFSTIASKYTLAAPPINLSIVSKTKNSITLSWQSAPGGSLKFSLQRSSDGINFTTIAAKINVLHYTDTNLAHSTTYYYRLFGFNGNGVITEPTGIISVMTDVVVDIMPPFRPTGVSGQFVGNMFVIKWGKVRYNEDLTNITDLNGYFVYRSSAIDGKYVKLTPQPLKTEEFADAAVGKIHYYVIKAVDIYSNKSLPSMILCSKSLPTTIILSEKKDLTVELPGAIPENSTINIAEVPEEKKGRVLKSFAITIQDIKTRKEITPSRGAHFNVSFNYAIGNIAGAPQFATSFNKDYAIYWFNGAQWLKLGGVVNKNNKTISIGASVLGKFQLRLTARSQFSVDKNQVYPKIITPNGDGKNDFLTIIFDGPAGIEEKVTAFIYDNFGRYVAKLDKRGLTTTSLRWDGVDDDNNVVPSGIYIYQLEAEGKIINGTVVVSR